MSKYDTLTFFLASVAGQSQRMTFSEIESVLGFALPASKKYPAWWSNNPSNNSMTLAWLAAGFHTEQVDTEAEQVTFVRQDASVATGDGKLPRSPLFGSMKGTTFVMPGVDLTAPMDIDWKYDRYDPLDVITVGEIERVKKDLSLSVSDKIRTLARMGVPRAEIARILGKRYQHVRNVLIAEAKRAA